MLLINTKVMKYDLKKICFKKLSEKFLEPNDEQINRLEFELKQIQSLGVGDTFIVSYHLAEMVKKRNGLIGPSTAFSSGSFVLYLLGVTAINPMKYGLLFEHFFPVDRIDTIAIEMNVDIDSLNHIRQELTDSDFLIDNLKIEDSPLCNVFELSINDNTIQLNGSKILVDILETLKEKIIDFENINLDNKGIFQKLKNNNEIVNMRKIDGDFLLGFTIAQEEFLSQFAPKSIEELAQVLAYVQPMCEYDLKSIMKRRKGEKDLTLFQEKYFGETNGIYTFPEQISFMLKDYLTFSSQEIYRYQKGERKKVSKWLIASDELYYSQVKKYNYDIIDMEQIWKNISRANHSMADKTRVVGEALLIYWWVWIIIPD